MRVYLNILENLMIKNFFSSFKKFRELKRKASKGITGICRKVTGGNGI
jgi:hypothetical protein